MNLKNTSAIGQTSASKVSTSNTRYPSPSSTILPAAH